jgi:hypothetical protein
MNGKARESPGTLSVAVEISPAELIDKVTILELKLAYIIDDEKLDNVRREYDLLSGVLDNNVAPTPLLDELRLQLKGANEVIWRVEDLLREHEKRGDFGAEFVELARSAYRSNDERTSIKRRINQLLGSALIEEKSHS